MLSREIVKKFNKDHNSEGNNVHLVTLEQFISFTSLSWANEQEVGKKYFLFFETFNNPSKVCQKNIIKNWGGRRCVWELCTPQAEKIKKSIYVKTVIKSNFYVFFFTPYLNKTKKSIKSFLSKMVNLLRYNP